ncbi:NADPH-dependent FMN reductase [Streptomyces tubercidicus]|uniref:NADPH-dependent FMN reductase n=1 Tax=Streptomyces tubercidicus TaxID=47759 RepID=UPI002E139006|nr:NAD(P)H-dependent oxidoreductase [Streptomyces tubercidicus]WSX18602.1 NAD(P)H-dependent oxidoreductase [Streptomyces tubercidicus]
MSQQPQQLRVAIVIGSTREGRFAPVVTQWIKGHLDQRDDMSTDVIDLAGTPLPTVLPAFGQPPAPGTEEALALVSPRLAAADAFVFVTPEYNHSFPASLKNAIDWHNEQWHAKPIGFVSYGGISGGLRAVEQLRVVMAELHATTIRNTVSLHNAWGLFDEEYAMKDARSDAAAKVMLDQLAWWGDALRAARNARPYAA